MSDGLEPITGDEILYRRIPANPDPPGWYDPDGSDRPSPYAFRANEKDTDGISLYRGKYATAGQVCAKGREGKQYFVVELSASDLLENGLALKPAPLDEDIGHCVLRDIRWDNATTDKVRQLRVLLAERLSRRVLGPFPGRRKLTG